MEKHNWLDSYTGIGRWNESAFRVAITLYRIGLGTWKIADALGVPEPLIIEDFCRAFEIATTKSFEKVPGTIARFTIGSKEHDNAVGKMRNAAVSTARVWRRSKFEAVYGEPEFYRTEAGRKFLTRAVRHVRSGGRIDIAKNGETS